MSAVTKSHPAIVEAHACRWEDRPSALDGSTLVLGGVDSLDERRRPLGPYLDIGMDVHAGDPPAMSRSWVLGYMQVTTSKGHQQNVAKFIASQSQDY